MRDEALKGDYPTPGKSLADVKTPEFEALYNRLCTNLSDIEFFSGEIYKSVSKFKPLTYPPNTLVEKEPYGMVDTFSQKVNLMQNTIAQLKEIDEMLKTLV